MVTLDWETDRTDGVTLVRLYVTAGDHRRVRIENRLDGPVWPPREEGQPAAGWNDDTFEGIVTPDHRLVAGYATPAQPTDPPVEVVADDPADAETPPGPVGGEAVEAGPASDRVTATDGGGSEAGTLWRRDNGDGRATGPEHDESAGDEPTPADVVRSLGDPVVPREAVPVPDTPDDPDGRDVDTTDEREAESTPTPTDESMAADADGSTSPPDSDSQEGPETPAFSGTASSGGESDVAAQDGSGTEDATDDGSGTDGPVDDGSGTDESALPREGVAASPDGASAPRTDAELVVPGAVRAWLRDVDRRLTAVERRRAARGIESDSTVQIAVAGDRRALARVADRVETLVGRAEAVERGARDPGDAGGR
jgi:hypothetical protein